MPRHSYLDERAPPNFSQNVLVGNWLERRYSHEEYSNSILPGLRAAEGCERHTTHTQDDYSSKVFKDPELLKNVCKRKTAAFDNFLRNTESDILFMHSNEHLSNYTTMNNLMYDIIPKMKASHCLKYAGKAGVSENLPEIDTLQSFGNKTTTGIRKYLMCMEAKEDKDYGLTSYAHAYGTYKGPK